jgi:large subunit ribosomal protein L17
MRHRVGHRKLGRITPHRMALLRNLATALFERERIRTTLMKAKELRPYAEKLITLARRDDDRLHARRLAARALQDRRVMKKLFDDLGARFAGRPGGYTRILRLGPRRGDGAEMAIVELIGSEYKPEKKTDEKGKKGAARGKAEAPAGGEKTAKAGAAKGGRKKAAPEP